MRIDLNEDDLAFALRLGQKRSGSMGHAETVNSPNMLYPRPPWWRHYVGVCGEQAFSKVTGYPVDDKTIGRGDDGTDFPHGIQVKAAYQPRQPRLLIPVSQLDRKIACIYVFVWLPHEHEFKVAHIQGWITRADLMRLKQGPEKIVVDSWIIRTPRDLWGFDVLLHAIRQDWTG